MNRFISTTTALAMVLASGPTMPLMAQDYPQATIDGQLVLCLPNKKAECPEGALCVIAKEPANCDRNAGRFLSGLLTGEIVATTEAEAAFAGTVLTAPSAEAQVMEEPAVVEEAPVVAEEPVVVEEPAIVTDPVVVEETEAPVVEEVAPEPEVIAEDAPSRATTTSPGVVPVRRAALSASLFPA